MDKRINGLAGAMRKIAEERDNRLRNGGAISADRVEQLQAFLAAEFPLETALNAAARHRDESLSVAEPVLPLVVHAALREQVRSGRAVANSSEERRRANRTAALAAAAIIVTAAVLHFSQTTRRPTAVVDQVRSSFMFDQRPPLLSSDQLFDYFPDRLTFRSNRLELASLEPSFFNINRALVDVEQPGRVLSLDLPIRQIHLDVEAVRTP